MTTEINNNNRDSHKTVIGTSSCAMCGGRRNYTVLYESTLKGDYSDINRTNFSARCLPDRVHGTIVKCRKCGLVRTLELIDRQYLSGLYKESAFTYKDILNNLTRTYRKIVIRALKYVSSKNSFLEIGCGNGFLLKEVMALGFKKVVGVEPSINAISFAEEYVKPLIKNTIIKNNLFPPASFDMIVGFQVFDHIQNPNEFLSICHKLIRSEGIIILMNHDVNSLSAKILKDRSPICDIEHPYLYGKDTMFDILKKNGFDIVDYYNPPSYFSFRYIVRLLPLLDKLKMRIINSKLKLLDVTVRVCPGNLCVIARKEGKE